MPQGNTKGKDNRSKIFAGILVCICVLIYLIYQMCSFFMGNSIQLYKVGVGSSESRFESQYIAVAIREEEVVYSQSSGYVNYFVGDSTPVSVGEDAYLIDESGTLYETLSESAAGLTVFDDEELLDIKNTIADFNTSFDITNYYDVYNFKYKLESQLLDLIYSNVFENSAIDLSAYSVLTSEYSGIMMHSVDGFEDVSADDMEASYFRKSNYERTIITSNDYVESGSAVYKVVTSEEWSLVIQIEDSSAFEDVSSLTIEFLKDGISATCDFYMYTSAGNTYGVLTLDDYMYRYVSDRYLEISVTDDTESGLLVPKTSVTTEQFYVVPQDYLTTGGNSSSYGLMVQTEEDGETSVQFIVPEIADRDDEYVYISSEYLKEGDVLVQSETNETYTVRIKENIEGVYVFESSSYDFTPVSIIGENGEFYVVEKESGSSALKQYDNIVEDAESVVN